MTDKDDKILPKDAADKKLSASLKYRKEDEYEVQQPDMSYALQRLLHENPEDDEDDEKGEI